MKFYLSLLRGNQCGAKISAIMPVFENTKELRAKIAPVTSKGKPTDKTTMMDVCFIASLF